MLHLLLMTGGAMATAWLFARLHLPVAWLLGPMLTGIVAAGIRGEPRPLDPRCQLVAQAILGLAAGVSFPLSTLKAAALFTLPLLIALLATAGLSLLNGYLLWRWAGVDQATGFMGSLPGAAPSMVAMSEEMGADPMAVAMLQYIRLLLVSFLAPLAVGSLFPETSAVVVSRAAAQGLPAAPLWLSLALLAAAGMIGAAAGIRLKLPSSTFLGPFFAALILSWSLPVRLAVPAPIYNGGLLVLGLSIGLRFDVPTALKMGRMAVIEAGLVIALIAASLGIGYGFHAMTGVDPITAVLGSTPGGMDTMVASALTLGADSGLVLAMQLTRWLLVLLLGPWVTGRLLRKAPTN